ncbi:hypothetical protein [Pseudomonas sp. UBA4617]|uniref:hypothetical protein n=1 Tax=Pseudomonas sp. UBA4617 TaxID=1947318 RepID=UPI0025CD8B03|nr:hypothetical protein [Pseudomonas sp. UBA4617]
MLDVPYRYGGELMAFQAPSFRGPNNPDEVAFKVKPEFVMPVVDAQVLAELQKSVMAGTISAETYCRI